jgi:hypothetical protein
MDGRLSACLARSVAAGGVPPFHFAIDKLVGSPFFGPKRRLSSSTLCFGPWLLYAQPKEKIQQRLSNT